MKRVLFAFFLFCVLFAGGSQSGTGKVWIFLKDRPYLSGKWLRSSAAPFFSIAAVRRRETRGLAAWDESDYPIDPSYRKALVASGAVIQMESRWLNAVSATCDSNCQKHLANLPFVTGMQPVAVYRRAAEPIIEERNNTFKPQTWNPNGLNYGNSKEQIYQLNVQVAHNKGFAGQGEIVAIFDGGFRKDHIAFKDHPIVAEHDFVFKDDNVQDGGETDSHGTGTWSCVGGAVPGKLYGPAYKSSFILAVTEDIRSETKVEEDNWVAAFEWADQLGATVVSSSLGYIDWYRASDLNGVTAITSKVASTAAQKGIVVANSAGNEGPGSSTLGAPADAKNILTVGSVDRTGLISGFSSRGPTADGRIKPEVMARGELTFVASSRSANAFGQQNGTSFSCPLVAGTAAVLLSAHPEWTPLQVREAFMKTASRAATPDNVYGYGIVNLGAALDYLPLNSIVIDYKPLGNTSNTTQPYKITARIRAFRGVNNTQLFVYWRRAGSTIFQKVTMTSLAIADQYQGLIPAQSKGTTVQYYISAKDSKGKSVKSPFKAPAVLDSFSVQ